MSRIEAVALKGLYSPTKSKERSGDEAKGVVEKSGETFVDPSASADAVVIQSSLNTASTGTTPDFQELYKSLSITAKEIVDKINERLKISLPNGVQSLKPEDVTPEATAERIVSGSTAFFDIYAKQNPGKQGEELLGSFMSEIRKGIGQGYNEAINILEGLGAFQFDGVKSGVERTRALIDEKLATFEAKKREELGLQKIEGDPALSPASVNAVA